MKKPKKTQTISVRPDPDVREGLERMAREQDRSLSYLLNLAARRLVEAEYGRKQSKK